MPRSVKAWKLRLVKGLYQRGFTKEDVQQLFRLIDWHIVLPMELEGIFRGEIHEFDGSSLEAAEIHDGTGMKHRFEKRSVTAVDRACIPHDAIVYLLAIDNSPQVT